MTAEPPYVWICRPCGQYAGDYGLVDDHSPPCDCCDLEIEPEAVQESAECRACGEVTRVLRWLERADYEAFRL